MPTKREPATAKSATEKKTRTRKSRAASGESSKAKPKSAKPARKAAKKSATQSRSSAAAKAPARRPARKAAAKPAKRAAAKPASEEISIDRVSSPILPVSPKEPAAADASSSAPEPAAPAPISRNYWQRAMAPIAATTAFLATLGALLLGYWTGYAVGRDAIGDRASTVAAAAEKRQGDVQQPPAPNPPMRLAVPLETQPQVEPAPAVEGLHLQVSALRSETAAGALQRKLEKQGFPVRVESAEDELVRVYVGPVSDSDDLRDWTSELREEGLEPFPKRL